VTLAVPQRVATPTFSGSVTVALPRTVIPLILRRGAPKLRGSAGRALPPAAIAPTIRRGARKLRGSAGPALPRSVILPILQRGAPKLRGSAAGASLRTAPLTLRGSAVPGCSSGWSFRAGWGFRNGCGPVVRTRTGPTRCGGLAGFRSGWPGRRLPAAAWAGIRGARHCRPGWRRRAGCRSGGYPGGRYDRRCPRRGWNGPGSLRSPHRQRCPRRGWNGPGSLRSPHRQRCPRRGWNGPGSLRSPYQDDPGGCRFLSSSRRPVGCRWLRSCRQMDGRFRVGGRCRRCCPRGPVTCFADSIRRYPADRSALPWPHQTRTRVSDPRGGPSNRRPVARARSRPPPTPTLRAVARRLRRRNVKYTVNALRAATSMAATLSAKMSGGVLLSHAVPHAVPSALKGLTSGFGMGPGVSPSPWPPKLYGDVRALRLSAGRPHLGNRTVDANNKKSRSQATRPISTGQLHTLPCFHLRPINPVV
jgi:hypothetical protein